MKKNAYYFGAFILALGGLTSFLHFGLHLTAETFESRYRPLVYGIFLSLFALTNFLKGRSLPPSR